MCWDLAMFLSRFLIYREQKKCSFYTCIILHSFVCSRDVKASLQGGLAAYSIGHFSIGDSLKYQTQNYSTFGSLI